MTTREILYAIESAVIDEAFITFHELCPPNSIEWDLEVDNFVEKAVDNFNDALYQSIQQEMFS